MMESTANNPIQNVLGPGLSDQMVTAAIEGSGYPLQLVVASELSDEFHLQEEWAFPDSEAVRTIDILATKELYEWKEPQPRARPSVSFVIECKQSDLPYVFFLSGTTPWLRDFPLIAGLKTKYVTITSDDDPSTWSLDPLSIFDMSRHPFLTAEAPICMTLSKCVRKGSDLNLSGSDAYQSLIFPLTKAALHLRDRQAPPKTAHYFDCDLIIPLAVVDAPMVGVYIGNDGAKNQLLPWVRVARHQPLDGEHSNERGTVLGVDVVHKDFLATYISQHAIPFANAFATLALKHHHVLADAKGFVSGMGKGSWENIEPRLATAGIESSGKRVKAIAKRISSSLSAKKGE
ncbi:MAG: hypothetical protein V5B38_06185 [Candidatus Accumulibacter propinquus]